MTNDRAIAGSNDKLPPQSIEAEENILGGILLDPEAMGRVIDILSPEMFYIDAHSDIYAAARVLHSQGKPTDLIHNIEYLNSTGMLFRVGGRNKLATLLDRTVSAVNIDALAELVRDKYKARQLISAGNQISMLASDEFLPISDRMEQAEKVLFDFLKSSTSFKSLEELHISQSLFEVFKDIEDRHEGKTLPGIPCGFYDLDAMTSGFQRGQLTIVAGRPSMGKSALAVNIAHNIAAAYRNPCYIFSLEVSRVEVTQRILSAECGIETGYFRSGQISKTQWEPLSKAVARLSEMPLFIDDNPCPSTQYMRSSLRKAIAKHGEFGMVVVDYLQLMGGQQQSKNRAQELGEITRQLKLMAREFNVPVIALSQLNRDVENRHDKRPLMSDLRDSGAIEQDADLILALYRDEYYNNNSPDRGIAEINILKHRNGPTGTIKLLFDAQFTKFKNLAR